MYKDIETFDWSNPTFRTAFWNWFDNLSVDEKKQFWYYPLDIAELYFYNAIYNKGVKISIKSNMR